MTTRFFLACALVLGCVASSGAQTAPRRRLLLQPRNLTIPSSASASLSYVQCDAELKNRDAFNAFDLTRALRECQRTAVEERSLPVDTGRATGDR